MSLPFDSKGDESLLSEDYNETFQVPLGEEEELETVIANASKAERLKEVFWAFLPLGFTAFGGPQAHISLFLDHFVTRRQWMNERMFSELLGLCQGLPGPSSTQMAFAIGASRGGLLGGILSFPVFSLPGLIIMTIAGLSVDLLPTDAKWLQETEAALAAAAVGLVAIAAYRLGSKLITSQTSLALMLFTASATLLIPKPWIFPILLVFGGLTTWIRAKLKKRFVERVAGDEQELEELEEEEQEDKEGQGEANDELMTQDFKVYGINVRTGKILFVLFASLFVGLLVLRRVVTWNVIVWFELVYRMGSLIYGGGQVLLPMLLTEMVTPGWISERDFFNGFALIQSLPGPMFNFSAFLGARVGGVGGALIFWMGLSLPGLLAIGSCFPFWIKYRSQETLQTVLEGVNASAIGLVVAAVFMLWNKAVHSDSFLTVVAVMTFSGVSGWKVPAPVAILCAGLLGFWKWVLFG